MLLCRRPSAPEQTLDSRALRCQHRLTTRPHHKHFSTQIRARSSLEAATQLAAQRAQHSKSDSPIFVDSFAQSLAGEAQAAPSHLPWDVIATRYLDDQLSQGIDIVNMDLKEDYRQVVLLGCGMDTRPYRLMWPEGTVIYEVASAEVHAVSAITMRAANVRIQRGCLHIRVAADLKDSSKLGDALVRAGFNAARLSIWGIQGLAGMQLPAQSLRQLLADVADYAAFGSMIMGELPDLPSQMAEDLLAEAGMLGRVLQFGQDESNFGLWPERPVATSTAAAAEGSTQAHHRLLFTAQHQRLSLHQMQTYSDHVEAAEDTDEDFFGNFS